VSEARRALVLAPGPLLSEAIASAFSAPRFDLTVVTQGRVLALSPAGISDLLESVCPEPDAVVVGDALFVPESGTAGISTGMFVVFTAVKHVVRGMLRRRSGQIIAVAPSLGTPGMHHASIVDGLAGFTKSVAREVGSRGITANVLALGSAPASDATLSPYVAAARPMESADVAAALAFLAAPDSTYFTGHVLWVDGGLGL